MSNKEFAEKIKQQGLIYSFSETNSLKECLDKLTIDYLSIFLQTDVLLSKYFLEKKDTPITFPIDFMDFAAYLGIKTLPSDLNYYNSSKASSLLSKIESKNEQDYIIYDRMQTRLYINYGICYQIAAYLYKNKNIICRNSKLYLTQEENIVDIIASFLILPPIATFNEITEYTKKNNRQIDFDEMFLNLVTKTQMPTYKVVTSYEKLKVLGYYFNSSVETKKDLINKYLDEEGLSQIKEEAIKTLEYKNKISHTLFL